MCIIYLSNTYVSVREFQSPDNHHSRVIDQPLLASSPATCKSSGALPIRYPQDPCSREGGKIRLSTCLRLDNVQVEPGEHSDTADDVAVRSAAGRCSVTVHCECDARKQAAARSESAWYCVAESVQDVRPGDHEA